MIETALIRVRMDSNGNRLGKPEIIEFVPDSNEANLLILAKIYARKIQNELAATKEDLFESETYSQKSERKSC